MRAKQGVASTLDSKLLLLLLLLLLCQVYVAVGDVLLGGLGFRDVLRPDAVDTVSALQSLGLRVFLLSGDDSATVQVSAGVLFKSVWVCM